MKTSLIAAIIFFPLLCFSQTKTETIDWILSKLDDHKVHSGDYGYNNYFIREGILISQRYWNTTGKFTLAYEATIPLKSVSQIKLDQSQVSFIFKLICPSKCSVSKNFDNQENFKDETLFDNLNIQIDKKDSTLVKRIPKALSHLIEQYGGKARVIPFKKEPF